jgi:chromosome segregation ATPase
MSIKTLPNGRVEMTAGEYRSLANDRAQLRRVQAETEEHRKATAEAKERIAQIERELPELEREASERQRILEEERGDWRKLQAREIVDEVRDRIAPEHVERETAYLSSLDDNAREERAAVLRKLKPLPEGPPEPAADPEDSDRALHQRALEVVRKTGCSYEDARKAVIAELDG